MLILMAGSFGCGEPSNTCGSRSGVRAAEVDQIASEHPATGLRVRGAAVSPSAAGRGATDGGGLMAGVWPGLHNFGRHSCRAAKSVQDF
jgi:hypothetical protein